MTIREGAAFLPSSGLREVEQFVRLHYEMDINIEGIEAISHLLLQLDEMEQRIAGLQNRIRFYQAADPQKNSGR